MVNYRKWKGLGSSLLFLTIVATQFQNCAPAGPGITATGQDGGPSASLVDTIDDAVTSTGLAFNEKSIEIPGNEQDLQVHGSCHEDQDGATLRWELTSEGNELMNDGFVDCKDGNFTVALSDLAGMDCDHEYLLEARLGFGQAGKVPLMIACE